MQWISSLNCPEYLDTVDKQLTKEEERADYFLQPETKLRLLKECELELIASRAEVLVNMDSGCDTMFNNKKLIELALMYRVFRRDETTLKYILSKMGPYIIKRGDKIVKDEQLLKDPIAFTTKLLELKAEMDELVEHSFQNDPKFQKQRNLSFQEFMNNCSSTPSFIASYCDNEFKKGLKGIAADETERRLNAIIRLFCCLNSRDIFIKQYTKHLSGRLLNKSSISQEAEETMLQKLKVECGHNTVNKMSKMFTDMSLTSDLMKEFRIKQN
jgi:Cullin family